MAKINKLGLKKTIGFILPLVLTGLVVLLALAVGIRGGFASRSLQTVNSSDPTTSWKTYNDTKNNYSIKYPADWNFRNSELNEPNWVVFFSPNFMENESYLMQGGKLTIYIDKRERYPKELSELGKKQDSESVQADIVTEEYVLVDGVPGLTRTVSGAIGIKEGNSLIITWVPLGDIMYEFICEYTQLSSDTISETCNQMLRETKFTSK